MPNANEIWNPEMCKTNRDLDRALMLNEVKDLQRIIIEKITIDKHDTTTSIHLLNDKLKEVETKIDTHLTYSKDRMLKEDEAKKFYKRTALILLTSILIQILAKWFPAVSKIVERFFGVAF